MRMKAKCQECGVEVRVLVVNDDKEAEFMQLKKGELFEHYCSKCGKVTTWEALE
jgi:endogenous inhibitor of DNA gyrase (YacG/DUF329 family)